jgi:hypothetical protein
MISASFERHVSTHPSFARQDSAHGRERQVRLIAQRMGALETFVKVATREAAMVLPREASEGDWTWCN